MYGDNLPPLSIESVLFDRTRDLGSLARALPGLSLSSVALSQWPTKQVKSSTPRCHRDQQRYQQEQQQKQQQNQQQQKQHQQQQNYAAPSASPLLSPSSPSASVAPPASPAQSSRRKFSLARPAPPSSAASSRMTYSSPQAQPRPRADSAASSFWSTCPSCSPCLTANAWPQLSCEHGAYAELNWQDWNQWPRNSVDSTASVALTTASTISDDDETMLVSRSPSPHPYVPAAKEVLAPATPVVRAEQRPPRPCLQPAKTGYALWVGNLSPHTTLVDLCELFGTPYIQSIYLIQRTGCAFVNYSTGAALDGAIEVFRRRDAKLHDHELVIKAQRLDEDAPQVQAVPPPVHSPDRFFICKSLTVEDLESAKQKGLWSTQLRNREKFNAAFHEAENVYLVFSANRTSAFYGFARLETPFGEEMAAENSEGSGGAFDGDAAACGFEVTPTAAICDPVRELYVPSGEIVLDPLRGSQFWKVDTCPYAESETERWAAPAHITWLSPPANTVPFSRTRQLKNSLNQNKPVKVARDGTEIDPAIGRELCEMFH